MTLLEGQWSLDGLVFGPGTDFNLARFEIGAPSERVNDKARAREDGDTPGREYRGGRVIGFELNALGDDYSVLERLAVLESAWDAESVRGRPGGVSVLAWRRGGISRRVYGRARRFTPVTTLDFAGNIPVSAEFHTIGHRFYDDAESTATVSITAVAQGGLVLPLRPPVILSGSGSGRTPLQVGGTAPAWLISTIHGPITNPTVEVVDEWSFTLLTTIAAGQSVVVDPTPWARTATRSDGANLAGEFTADSRRLSLLRVPPGPHEVILRGQDPTGTASLSTFWRSVWSSY